MHDPTFPSFPIPPDPLPTCPLPTRQWLKTREAGDLIGVSEKHFLRIADAHGIIPSRPSPQVVRWWVEDIHAAMHRIQAEGGISNAE